MSILLQTSFGDLTIDLNYEKCPTASKNFIKLCKIKHYNNAIFANVQKNYITQIKTKNPTTIYKEVYKQEAYQYFQDQVDIQFKLNKVGLVCTSNLGPNLNNSEFFITLSNDNLTYLNGKHSVFGRVAQGFEVLQKINQSFTDQKGRPYMNVRILHTHIIYDPFEDLQNMKIPLSPKLQIDPERLQAIEHLQMLEKGKTQQDIAKATKEQKAKKQTVTLEILGDLPDADAKPPENVLFICKLNPVTEQRDLELIFSRFGPIKSCEIVRDWKTGQSLQYGFIQYENANCCQEAYLKMQNVLIDDRRIHVDFCQSVSKLWPKFKKNALNLKKPSGQSKQQKNKELIPKYKQGKQYYGERSNKYDIVIQQKKLKQQTKKNETLPQKQISKNLDVVQTDKLKSDKIYQQISKQKKNKQHQRSRSKSKHKKQKKNKKQKKKFYSSSDSSRSKDVKHKKHKEKS